jgi:DNA end-binding protein Ku
MPRATKPRAQKPSAQKHNVKKPRAKKHRGSKPRAIWSGSIAFGLVNAPVQMYAAIDEHDLELHLVHTKDGARIGYQKVCKNEEKPVPDDEIAKAYELNGKLVLLEPEDFAAAESDGFKTIEILSFVKHEEIDPIYLQRSYYLGPQEGGEKVYLLLVEAMEKAGLSAVVRYVFHDREYLGALRVREGVLVLARMHFADEIRPADGIKPRQQQIDQQELDMALQLIRRIEGEFDPSAYEDTYRDRLLKVIKAKQRGGETRLAPAEEPEETPDLMEALRASLAGATRSKADGSNGRARDENGDLSDLTVDQLNAQARKLGVEGRSKMSKRQLVSAIEKKR